MGPGTDKNRWLGYEILGSTIFAVLLHSLDYSEDNLTTKRLAQAGFRTAKRTRPELIAE